MLNFWRKQQMNETEKYIVKIVEYLNQFFMVLSDGYNPTIIWLKIEPHIKEAESVFKEEYTLNEEFMVKKVNKTKKTLHKSLKSTLDHYFDWSLDHLRCANNAEEIFKKEHNLNELMELIRKVKEDLVSYFDAWNPTLTEYTVDTDDGSLAKFVFMDSSTQSAHLYFGNFIH